MKARSLKAILFTFILAATTTAFAGGKETVDLSYETKVGGTSLAKGTYTVAWDDSGKVEFLKGKKVVATGNATIKPASNVRATSVSVSKSAEGATLREIEVRGKNVTLVFPETSSAQVTAAN